MARDFEFLGYALAPESGPYSVPPYSVPVWSKEAGNSNAEQTCRPSLLTTPTAALAAAAEGFPAWDVLDAAHMLVASLIVDLVADADRPGFLRKMDRVLRDRVKEIAARQRPTLVI